MATVTQPSRPRSRRPPPRWRPPAPRVSTVRIRGARHQARLGPPAPRPDVELRTAGLSRIVEHNAGDLTAILEAGVPLAEAQKTFAAAGQMLALDPAARDRARQPTPAATIGGVVATGDCGPLRHRYGAPRDLIVGRDRRAQRRHDRPARAAR